MELLVVGMFELCRDKCATTLENVKECHTWMLVEMLKNILDILFAKDDRAIELYCVADKERSLLLLLERERVEEFFHSFYLFFVLPSFDWGFWFFLGGGGGLCFRWKKDVKAWKGCGIVKIKYLNYYLS